MVIVLSWISLITNISTETIIIVIQSTKPTTEDLPNERFRESDTRTFSAGTEIGLWSSTSLKKCLLSAHGLV